MADEPFVAPVPVAEPAAEVSETVDEAPAEASATETAVTEPTEEEAMTETRQRPLTVDAETFGRPAADAPVAEAEATETLAAAPVAAGAAAGATSIAGLYRDDDHTQVIDTSAALEAEAAEEERRAEQLRLEKEARDQRLGLVATSEANAQRDLNSARRPGVSGFGSFGLLVLRLVTAFVLGVAAYQILGNVSATADYLGQTALPYPREIAWGLGFTLAVMAVLLVLGLGVRIVGLLLAAIAGASLAFLRWGQFSIFSANMEGFHGDKDLILAAIGILLFAIGGGKVGIDGAISKARWNSKLAKRS